MIKCFDDNEGEPRSNQCRVLASKYVNCEYRIYADGAPVNGHSKPNLLRHIQASTLDLLSFYSPHAHSTRRPQL